METPSKVYLEYGYLKTKPFYRETWFVVALAAASIVIIIMVVAILCVKSKTYKYKGKTCYEGKLEKLASKWFHRLVLSHSHFYFDYLVEAAKSPKQTGGCKGQSHFEAGAVLNHPRANIRGTKD